VTDNTTSHARDENSSDEQSRSNENNAAHNLWLKQRFSEQHEKLIPVVAVADIFFSCNQERQVDERQYRLIELITAMDKNILAEKLISCLGTDNMQSDVALNFGLLGCFQSQLSHLTEPEQKEKMERVKQAILSLSFNERRKSFTQCVTEQAIHYLK
jgi:hypothetical protein